MTSVIWNPCMLKDTESLQLCSHLGELSAAQMRRSARVQGEPAMASYQPPSVK